MNYTWIPVCTALALSAFSAQFASAKNVISSKKTGENAFEVTLRSTTIFDIDNATTLIVPVAQELCGNSNIALEKYTFSKTETIGESNPEDAFQMVQNVKCNVAPRQNLASARTPQLNSEAAIEAARNKVRVLSTKYFDRLYSNVGDNALAALESAKKGGPNNPAIFETALGTEININLFRLSVYDNLPSSPQDGIYIAADYDNRVGNVAHHCGYLVWHSWDGEEFSLGRTESGTLPSKLQETMSKDQIESALKQLRCAIYYE